MECNKEEAIRAKELAQKKIQTGDFAGARKLLGLANRLYAGLDNLSQLVTVCDVHFTAQTKVNGSEMDWYGILQVEKSADEGTIRKQYRKLALLLHPDKNKFAGAEAAFKLIGEANRVLSDPAKRSLHDIKCRNNIRPAASKPPPAQSQRNNVDNRQKAGVQNSTGSEVIGFWTCCENCGVRYRYMRQYINKILRCQTCQKCFTATEYNAGNTRPTTYPFSGQRSSEESVRAAATQNNGPTPKPSGIHCAGSDQVPVPVAERNSKKEKVVRKPAAHVKNDVEMPKSNSSGTTNPAATRRKETETSKTTTSRKRKGSKVPDGSSEPQKTDDSNASEAVQQNTNGVRSVRKKQEVPGASKENAEEFVIPPLKKAKTNSASVEEVKKTYSSGRDKEVVHGQGDNEENDVDEEDGQIEFPDPEFNDFELKSEDGFAAHEVWAIYDPADGMPRYYARIKKVFTGKFKLKIIWLEPLEDNIDEENEEVECVGAACGEFTNGDIEDTDNYSMFSHQMTVTGGRGRKLFLYPRKGETWACFKDWDLKWMKDRERCKPPFKYEFVEILSEFAEKGGVKVAHMRKIKGFVSLFEQTEVAFLILPSEISRFSHRIPSYRMTGKERDGVPVGSYELDPAALPTSVTDKDGDTYGMKMETQSLNNTVDGPLKTGSPEKHDNISLEKDNTLRRSPRRSNVLRKNLDQVSGSQVLKEESRHCLVNENMNTPKKSENVDVASKEALKIRKSPRDISKKMCQVSGENQSSNPNKHGHNDLSGESNGLSGSLKTKSRKVEPFDFKKEATVDKFQIDQIWALYNVKDGLPNDYVQVKKIETTPNFRLQVAVLQYSSQSSNTTQLVPCGTFKVIHARTRVVLQDTISHQVHATRVDKGIYEVYPKKGEVWAIYKNKNSDTEYDIAEVLEVTNQIIKLAVLSCVDKTKNFYKAQKSQRSKMVIIEIPKTEAERFSHQIPAFHHGNHLSGFWELDRCKNSPRTIILDC